MKLPNHTFLFNLHLEKYILFFIEFTLKSLFYKNQLLIINKLQRQKWNFRLFQVDSLLNFRKFWSYSR